MQCPNHEKISGINQFSKKALEMTNYTKFATSPAFSKIFETVLTERMLLFFLTKPLSTQTPL